MTGGASEVKRPYGLRRRPTYDELVQYIKRDNGEFLVHAPDRQSTIVEMMSPYLSAWKTQQQAMIAKKQAELAYWTLANNGGGDGDAPLPMRAGDEDFASVPGEVDAMVDGRENALAQHRLDEWRRTQLELNGAAEREEDRMRHEFFIGTPAGSDPDLELAAHEGVPLPGVPPMQQEAPPSQASLRDAALRGGRMGAITGTTTRAAMLARDVAGTALQGLRRGPVVAEGLGRLIGRQYGSLSLLENAAANVGRTAGMEQTGVALGALAGEGLEAAGLTALGAGTLPLSGAVGGALLTAAAIGAVTGVGTGALGSLQGRLVTGVHWMGDELRHLAHNAGALGAQEVGIDARPAAMDLQRRSAVGPDAMVRTSAAQVHSYEQARQAAGLLGEGNGRANGGYPGGMSGPPPLPPRRVARNARPSHAHGLGRG